MFDFRLRDFGSMKERSELHLITAAFSICESTSRCTRGRDGVRRYIGSKQYRLFDIYWIYNCSSKDRNQNMDLLLTHTHTHTHTQAPTKDMRF